MMARFPSVVDFGANDEPRVNMSCHNVFSNSEMLANKIDGTLDVAQAGASATLAAKAYKTLLPALSTDTVKENHGLAKQNQALVAVIQEMKSREDRTTYWYKELEKTNSALYSHIQSQHYQIEDLEARLANNQAELISELQNTITTLEEAVDEAAWTEESLFNEIQLLKERVDSKEESLNQLRENNYGLYDENCRLNSEVGRLRYQINNTQACCPGMDIDMDIRLSKEATSELQYQIDNMQACRPGK
jgi:chromosome segregation ATPase